MHLKSLTLKGFKSFASPTTLDLEPGVTCVVGPNGSGKSNVVDALSWVMGEQGAKTLRGGKMEDVIFGGTTSRPPLGRAEVTLTIDNSDGALPIEYSEVTLSRIMFRSGGSEYAINGTPCRLLDVQELLSDSGIGREMHVIVGQGQLDTILHATPDDRRGFIEEAAGVLKHRKRKEKTLRKLDALTDKMQRLGDLTAELRRQLKPLGRQADVARRAVVIQADARDAKLRLLADDLSALSDALAAEQADETALREQRQDVESRLLSARAREADLAAAGQQAAPTLAVLQQQWFGLSGLTERFRAVASVAAERAANLAQLPAQPAVSSDPGRMEDQARVLHAEHDELSAAVRALRDDLTAATAARATGESELAAEESRVETSQRSTAERRERLAMLQGRVTAAAGRRDARAAEIRRLTDGLADAQSRLEGATAAFADLERQVTGLGEGEADLDGQYEQCRRAAADAERQLADVTGQESTLAAQRGALQARIEALRSAVSGRSSIDANVLDRPGVLGRLADSIRVAPGWEQAVTAALGDLADAALVDSLDTGVALLTQTSAARLVVAANGRSGPVGSLAELVECPPAVAGTVRRLLADYAPADDLTTAHRLVARDGRVLAVTRQGHVIGADRIVAWGDESTTTFELAAQIDAAELQERALGAEADRLRFAVQHARQAARTSAEEQSRALAALHESDAAMAAVADELGTYAARMRGARNDAARITADLTSAGQALDADTDTLAEAEAALGRARREGVATQGPDRREQLQEALGTARRQEMDVRLALRTLEERAGQALRRSRELRATAQAQRVAAVAAQEERIRRERQREIAVAVRGAAELARERAEALATAADSMRRAHEGAREERDAELGRLRATISDLGRMLEDLTDSVHRDEVVRTEQLVRIEQLGGQAMAEFGIESEALLSDYGPTVLVAPSPRAPGDEEDGRPEPEPYPYDRGEQERRLRSAERALALLGRVNPLALEEFAALEERHQFLSAQVDDLRQSRDDLLGIIKEVDDRMEQVFAGAFADTAQQFERVFAQLFPGGTGRLVLTDPDDLLLSGVEVEARPPGKKVKRLALLSGGERSLTAIAFLVALFKARPSPFYVLDEIEAALDDTNLGRLLGVIDELRTDSQLIVISHQKRTMETADALYGVSMRGDGVSTVISQRLREPIGV